MLKQPSIHRELQAYKKIIQGFLLIIREPRQIWNALNAKFDTIFIDMQSITAVHCPNTERNKSILRNLIEL